MLGCKRLSQPELVPISKATKRVVTSPTWTPCPEQVTQSSLSNLSGFLSCAALVTFLFSLEARDFESEVFYQRTQ